jgi:hypothetical protein
MNKIQVRYNTDYDKKFSHPNLPEQKRWRVLINGEQILADYVEIRVPAHTTTDTITTELGSVLKKHISCECKYVIRNYIWATEFVGGINITKKEKFIVILSDTEDFDRTMKELLVNINGSTQIYWSETKKKWKLTTKDDFIKHHEQITEVLCDHVSIKPICWTSDGKPMICFNSLFEYKND